MVYPDLISYVSNLEVRKGGLGIVATAKINHRHMRVIGRMIWIDDHIIAKCLLLYPQLSIALHLHSGASPHSRKV